MSRFIFTMFKELILNVLIKNEKNNIFETGGYRVYTKMTTYSVKSHVEVNANVPVTELKGLYIVI